MTSDATTTHSPGSVTIRRLSQDDQGDVELLAQLDSSPTPAEPVLGAVVEGRLLAATSLSTGETISDPFSRTAELRSLLELRAAQLRRRTNRERRRWTLRSHPAARAALASSPPGGGGRLLTLLPRF